MTHELFALLVVGAMGEIQLRFPCMFGFAESMEGPTPISALIHAATMVTAVIYMVARMSPTFCDIHQRLLSVVLVIGATTCFFIEFLAIFQFDITDVLDCLLNLISVRLYGCCFECFCL